VGGGGEGQHQQSEEVLSIRFVEGLVLMPSDSEERKRVPLFSGLLRYFPNALVAVARRSQEGNDQHHPGTELHWDKAKSSDSADALLRHLVEGELDALAWRALETLERAILNGYRPASFHDREEP